MMIYIIISKPKLKRISKEYQCKKMKVNIIDIIMLVMEQEPLFQLNFRLKLPLSDYIFFAIDKSYLLCL